LKDSTGSVRVAAAYASVRHGNAEPAWPVFAAALAADQRAELRLEALNYLTNLPNRPASFRPLYEAAKKSESREENYVARAAEYLLTFF
jgi:hypothetical protein